MANVQLLELQQRRRVRVLLTFCLIWSGSVVIEAANFALLGLDIGKHTRFLFSGLVVLLGIFSQIIFQGPSRTEILYRVAEGREGEPRTIDRVYLRFSKNRAVRIVIVLTMASALLILTDVVRGPYRWELVGTSAFFGLIVILRILVLHDRVIAGRFGTTQYEARELLHFVSKLYGAKGPRFDPPGGLPLLLEDAQSDPVPLNAQAAL